jgi:DNA processing protein
VETIEHILEALRGWQHLGLSTESPPAVAEHPLLQLLHAAPQTSEALATASGWALPKVLGELTELELAGRAVCESGRWFARVS